MRHLQNASARCRSFIAKTLVASALACAPLAAEQEPSYALDMFRNQVLEMNDTEGIPLRARLMRKGELYLDPYKQLAQVFEAQASLFKVQEWVRLYDAGSAHNDIFLRLNSLATNSSLETCAQKQTGKQDILGKRITSDVAYRYCAAGAREGETGPKSLGKPALIRLKNHTLIAPSKRALVLLSYSDFNGATEVEEFSKLLDTVRQSYKLSYFVAQSSAEATAVLKKHRGGPRIIVGHPRNNGVELMRERDGGVYSDASALAANIAQETVTVYGCELGNVLAPAIAKNGAHTIGALRTFTALEARVTGTHPLIFEFTVNGENATYNSGRQ